MRTVFVIAPLAWSVAIGAQEAPQVLEEIIVLGHPLSSEGITQPAAVLEKEALHRALGNNIAETTERIPGVHNASYGTAVGRPVIHGLGGPRVRVLEDRIGTMDVSVNSADHAVTVESFLAERIEILKGPSTLLYGSGAIGGVVDVHTGRIPHAVPEALNGKVELRAADNADQRQGAVQLSGGTGSWAFHLDAIGRDADPYDIPGFAESSRLRALEELEEEEHDEEEEGDEHHEEEEEVRDTLPGSQLESSGFAFGTSYVTDSGFYGLAISHLSSEYGLPGGHGHGHEEEHDEEEEGEEEHEHEEEEGQPVLDVEQTRIDLEFGLENPFAGFASMNLRLGYNDYEHQEIEPNGEVATDFANKAFEFRGELVHEPWGEWRGALGVQVTGREFEALGEEAFLQPVDSDSIGLFWVGERSLANTGTVELGARIERVDYQPSDAASADRDFDVFSVSAGVLLPFGERFSLALHSGFSTRAPTGEELYSNGAHLATQRFEVGDETLDEEQAINFAATLTYRTQRARLEATLYHNRFEDYIYQQGTGAEEDELPVAVFTQEDAVYTGLDFSARLLAVEWEGGALWFNGRYDWITADLQDVPGNDNVPLLPPMRFGFGVSYEQGPVIFDLDYLYVDSQTDTSELELATSSYNDLRAYLGYSFSAYDTDVELFLQGRNLGDEEQRNHTSLVKEFAPRPGRTVELGLRLQF